MRGLCISGPSNAGESGNDLPTTQASSAPVQQSYVVSRQHYSQVTIREGCEKPTK